MIAVSTVTVMVSCGGGGTADSTPTAPVVAAKVLTSINVSLGSATVAVGSTTSASAAGLDQNGASIATGTVTWSVGSTSIATVTSAGVVSAVGLGQTTVTASAGGKQGSANMSVIAAPVSGKFRIVFARGSPCLREDPSGCDLYYGDYNMTTKTLIGSVTPIATTAGVSEFFPGLSSTGRFVVYNRISYNSKGQAITNDVWAADLTKSGSATLLITNARFPQISSDDKKIYFSREGTRGDLLVAPLTINETAGTISAGAATNLTGTITSFVKAEDPMPIGTTGKVAFHYQVTETSRAAIGVLDPSTGTYASVADGAGHVSVNSASTIVASSLGGTGLSLMTAKTGGWNPATITTLPSQSNTLASLDTAYNTRVISRWSYPEYVDDTHVIASVMAGTIVGDENVYTMSRLFLVTLNGASYELLTALLGGVYADYCTVAVRAIQ